MSLTEILAHPITRGALAGALAAGAVDRQAFRTWKSFDDAQHYAWNLAVWRWFQGAVIGAFTGAGLGL